jgi:hypothetical protein
MPKQLKAADVDSKFCITVRELAAFLTQASPNQSTDENPAPVLLNCGGKNYRLASFRFLGGKPILVGKRGKRD